MFLTPTGELDLGFFVCVMIRELCRETEGRGWGVIG